MIPATLRFALCTTWLLTLGSAHPQETGAAAATATPAAPADAAAVPSALLPAAARLDQLVVRLEALQEPSMALSAELQTLLRDEPQLVPTLPARLLDGPVGSDTADTLILALQVVGTAQAQQALGTIFVDSRQRHLDRLRAVIAQGSVAAPSDDGLASLWYVTGQRSDPDAVDLSNTAMLALGIATHTLQPAQPERSAALRAELVRSLHGAHDGGERCLWLKALGNTKDATAAAEAAPYLLDESAPVRASAAQALGLMGSDASLDLLTSSLAIEPRGAVRASIVAGMRRLEPGLHALTAVHARVLQEGDPQARAVMVQYLGEHLAELPDARATLEHLRDNDPTQRIRLLAAYALGS